MRLLLDTCAFLWMIGDAAKLSPRAREALEDGDNTLVLNQVSAWEIQIKAQSGKLALEGDPEWIVREGIDLHGVVYERLADEAIWHLAKLPDYHRDPFDRLLIASALTGGLKMVTPDRKISRYSLAVVW